MSTIDDKIIDELINCLRKRPLATLLLGLLIFYVSTILLGSCENENEEHEGTIKRVWSP